MALISQEQLALNKALHQTTSHYGNRKDGGGIVGHLPQSLLRMHELGICDSVLDYGTGKGKLVANLRQSTEGKLKIDGYDPAVEQWSTRPDNQYDIITSLDVLEHIEVSSIGSVLEDISSLTKRFCLLAIDLQPAVKTLADGRNAHIMLAPQEWWVGRVAQHFKCLSAFPIYHLSGAQQKTVIVATNELELLPLMYGFITKLKIFNFRVQGGSLGKVKLKK